MKLLIITASKAFENHIKNILAEAQVSTYSYNGVVGYRDSTLDAVESNWFGTEMNKTPSVLFFAFVSLEQSDRVFHAVAILNKEEDFRSKVHLAIANIEKSN